jgi:hypothetical protein
VTTTSGAAYDERLHIADGSLNSIAFASQSKKKRTSDACPFLCDPMLFYKPAAALSAAALSERSQLNSGSSRPK